MRRRLRQRAPFVALSVLALACGRHDLPAPASPSGDLVVAPIDTGGERSIPALDLTGLASSARAAMEPYVIANGDAPPATVYTWTTIEQAAEVSRFKLLLTRDVSPIHGAAFYDQYVRLVMSTDRIAALLGAKAFAKARFAWVAPWATAMGWPDETYGDRLVSVTLKPEAWVVVLSTANRAPARVVDLKGKPVATADLLAHPERLAAVYFVHDDARAGTYSTSAGPLSRAGYREIVLCNEAMIARFSIGTVAERRAIATSVKALEAMLAYVEASPTRRWDPGEVEGWNRSVAREWSAAHPTGTDDPISFYERALALPNDLYAPESRRLRDLIEHLTDLPEVDPTVTIVHEPTVRFVAADAKVVKPAPPPRPPPATKPVAKPKRPMQGTF